MRSLLAVLLGIAVIGGAATLPAMPAFAEHDRDIDVGEIVFREVERRLIYEYFCEERGLCGHHDGGGKAGKDGLPPGLAKRDQLPPGLAKRRELPPGLAKRALPYDLRRRLPAPRPGTRRVIIDHRVVLIEAATNVVLDVLFDVVTD
jgi:hypothetical protein